VNILNIIAAPFPKRAISYDPIKDELVFENADIIGLIEMFNPDDPTEVAVVPMYMTADNLGGYGLPQFSEFFLELADIKDDIDYGKYADKIAELKEHFNRVHQEMMEPKLNNVTYFNQKSKKDKPDYEN
jgi:hypothetical protein